MSKRIHRWLVPLAAVGLIAPPLAAQIQQTQASLVRQIDSLLPLLQQADVEAEAAAERRLAEARAAVTTVTDTISVGLMRIVTVPSERATAERLYGEVWAEEYAAFIDDSPAMDDHLFTFMWSRVLEPIHIEGPVRRVEMMGWRGEGAVEEAIRGGIGSVLMLDLGRTRLSRWAGGGVRAPAQPEEIYRDLALSASKASRACLEGEALSCWLALGLGIEEDPYPLDDWYTADERRALVGRWFGRRSEDALRDACLDERRISSCDLLLGDLRGGVIEGLAPLQPVGRNALLWIALNEGGQGAWGRLRANPEASPAEALLYASGATREELANAWRDYVLANRPPSHAGTGLSVLLAVAWMAVFGTLALRSTRWRSA
jgi:hypothetical protein